MQDIIKYFLENVAFLKGEKKCGKVEKCFGQMLPGAPDLYGVQW